ncbi:bifunctional 4-hydroxy-2-oxoglutarate aldolase/2-dehydro-3-deoxy-phosphogluconate aldolase [Flavisolibacter ginsenosidimutans]|uniref:Bifunctional 4-hydroxy-2-oxoglutarate aldolase/2-dehydro-3-deoxy-phosphogluconate aldolase n=1 Tax=Flavisolibacter ginsenosidimutans TaxID=661481 RepID=A0A5B8UE34_9BACT|nr:bifunctional 4-hydroxy-2-oxoglutarate aldolase/2-dehydro-3-deoxy-phosphogluconate aldolase [Flavisolibacter ginsenosidimutans]QEC54389.1 bifunctional 4-hydroxy-2-oxoglutarate aldolase/2-dehydro-3-deoxy-phosphogluconate aldolase [Flavisolibacter ginsenosidimutans]
MTTASSQILTNKIVAILRGLPADTVMPVVEALIKGGIKAVEITLNTPGAFDMIKEITAVFGNKLLTGAGTVMDVEQAAKAIDAGAGFIISPSLDLSTIAYTKAQNCVSIPGAFTATEIVTAYKAGADIVKVFPASHPQYIKDLQGPLSHIPMMPTGGVSLENIAAFQKAGAVAFGIGSALVPSSLTKDTLNEKALVEKAKAFVRAVQPSSK